MEINSDLVPYLVKRFKILSMGRNKNNEMDLLYVDELDDEQIDQLENFIEQKVNLKQSIPEDDFWDLASETYEDVSFVEVKNNENKTEIKKSPEKEPGPESDEDEDNKENPLDKINLKDIPIEYLVKEIRSRQIKTDAEAIIHITEDRNANFEFTKLSWPVGKFKVSMKILEEININEEINNQKESNNG